MADTSDIEASNSVVSVPVSLVAMIPLRYWTLVRARDPEQASRRALYSHICLISGSLWLNLLKVPPEADAAAASLSCLVIRASLQQKEKG